MADYPPKPNETNGQYAKQEKDSETWSDSFHPHIKRRKLPTKDENDTVDSSVAMRGTSGKEVLAPPVYFDFGVVWLSVKWGSKESRAYNDGRNGRKENGADDFCFAPDIDDQDGKLTMAFEIYKPKNIRAVKLEIFPYSKENSGDDKNPVWVKKWGADLWGVADDTYENFMTLLDAGDTDIRTGKLVWKDHVKLTGGEKVPSSAAAAAFPDKLLTAQFSPYQVRMTVSARAKKEDPEGSKGPDKLGYPLFAWTYAHVLVHSMKLAWGDKALLKQSRADVTADNEASVLKYEKDLIDALVKANAEPVSGKIHEVVLSSNLFGLSRKGEADCKEMFGNKDFELYRDLWGNGARIPLVLSVLVKKADGSSTDQAPKALGTAKVLWDWSDKKPDRWKDPLSGGAAPKTEAYLEPFYTKEVNKLQPAGSFNCQKDFGGKHGASDLPLFLPSDGGGELPYKVEPGKRRKWAAFSEIQTSGTNAGKTGVIVQPSRMAGDTYTVQGYLSFDQSEDSLNDIAAPATLSTPDVTFKVFRGVKVHCMVRGQAKLDADPAAVIKDMKDAYRQELDMVLDVQQHAVDNASYKTALQNAIAIVEHDAPAYEELPLLPLLLRHLVDKNPPADSAGVVCRPWASFFSDLEDEIKQSTMQLVTSFASPDNFFAEELTGAASGAKGLILVPPPRKPEYNILLIPPGQPPFRKESVTGTASGATSNIEVSAVRSCWGREFKPPTTSSTEKKHKEKVTVVFPGNAEVDVEFKKTTFMRSLKTEIPADALPELRRAFLASLVHVNAPDTLTISFKGRTDTDNARTRMSELEGYFNRLIDDERLIIDRKRIWEMMRTDGPLQWHVFKDRFGRITHKALALNLLGDVIYEYAKIKFPGEQGIFLLHMPGRFKPTKHPDGPEVKEPKLAGACYSEITRNRNQSIVYFSSIAAAEASADPVKSIGAVLNHELAHALLMPHSPRRDGAKNAPNTRPECHVRGDDCVMNYALDTKHFCGVCMFRMRGWNWKSERMEGVKSVEILDGTDTTYLHGPGVQYVNLPRDDKWLDGAFAKNVDRLSRKVRFRVDCHRELKQKVKVLLVGHLDNVQYTATEKTKKPSFKYEWNLDLFSSVDDEFPFELGDSKEVETDDAGDCIVELELGPAAGDRYKLCVWDDTREVYSHEIETRRLVYYMTMHTKIAPHAVPSGTFRGVVEPEYKNNFVDLVFLGHELVDSVVVYDPDAPIDAVNALNLATQKASGVGGKKYSEFQPYLLRFVFCDHMANSIAKETLPIRAPIGPAQPVVRVPVQFRAPPATDPTADMRKPLWRDFGPSLTYGKQTTVGGNNWFISATATLTDNSVQNIPLNKLTPVETDPGNRPDLYNEVDVDVTALNPVTPQADIKLNVIALNQSPAGQANIKDAPGLMIMASRVNFVVKSHGQQISAAIHELGHAFGMVTAPDSGLDATKTHYDWQGDHCYDGIAKKGQAKEYHQDPGAAASARCVMFGQIPQPPTPPRTAFCGPCREALRKIDASAGFLK
jgi:hypothetical protein